MLKHRLWRIMTRVLVIGCNGQDGQLLTRSLEENGHIVYGLTSPVSTHNFDNTTNLRILRDDFTKYEVVKTLLSELQPSIVYHLASVNINSYARLKQEQITSGKWPRAVQVGITENVLRYIHDSDLDTRFILAGSSRMFSAKGDTRVVSRDDIPNPVDFYGVYKTEAHLLLKNARKKGVNAGTAILFNHESHLRRSGFLFPHLADEIFKILTGLQKEIRVLDADAKTDWHVANETVIGLMKMSQQIKLEDYVLASGNLLSVRDLITNYFWEYHRCKPPALISTSQDKERSVLVGNINETTRDLGWKPITPVTSVLDELINLRSKG